MTRKTFNQGFATLFNAFTYAQERTTPETEEVYWHVLQYIPDTEFNAGVTKCLIECKFFPAISDLVERIYPTYDKLPPYNPWGGPYYGKPIKITAEQQLAVVNRKARALLEAKTTNRIENKRLRNNKVG